MRRLLTSAALFLCSLMTFAQFSGSGSGTESDPYRIFNSVQLNQLRNFLGQSDVYFKLMNDIDLTEFLEDESPTQGWQPIGGGVSTSYFKGILDGNGKTISGLWINRSSTSNVGFFGYTSEATIKNLKIKALSVKGKKQVGGLCGQSVYSSIENCSFIGELVSGESCIGGLCGEHYGTITNCSFAGKVEGNTIIGGLFGQTSNSELSNLTGEVEVYGTGEKVGGIVGRSSYDDFLNCRITNSIIRGSNYVGGACGYSKMTTDRSKDCIIYADIQGTNYIGGLHGYIDLYYTNATVSSYTTISSCGHFGSIDGGSYVGGLVGYCNTQSDSNEYQLRISQSFSVSNITATGSYVGGVIGYTKAKSNHYSTITNSYHSGNISVAGTCVGGIAGYNNYGEISQCMAMGNVSGSNYVGGISGIGGDVSQSVAICNRIIASNGNDAHRISGDLILNAPDENKAYNRTVVICNNVEQDIEDNYRNGTGVGNTTLKSKATYVAFGFDFNNTWTIQETECYPYMKSQTAPPVFDTNSSKLVSGKNTISGNSVDGGTVFLDVDGDKQETVSSENSWSFAVEPLQAGQTVSVSAKANNKEQSYYISQVVKFLGEGTENDPYQIYTAEDLSQATYKGYYKLMNDIDLTTWINTNSPSYGWIPVGLNGSETIHIDGNSHKITGLWTNRSSTNIGLFSQLNGGSIKNLEVNVANGKNVYGGNNTGILIGKMVGGVIENCSVKGTVKGYSNAKLVGGLVGTFDGGSISDCAAQATITASSSNGYIGGVAGQFTGNITKCKANVTIVAGGSTTYAGGIAGGINGTLSESLSTGTIKVTGSTSYAAGVAGESESSSSITNCYSTVAITSSYCAAGVVAYNYGKVENCYASGDLNSNNIVAGIIGYNDGANATVAKCVALNNIISVTYESQSSQSGGYGQRILGDYKNGAPDPQMNNYALKTMQVSLNNVPQIVSDDLMNGTSKTADELKQQSTYQSLSWNFSDIWGIDEGESNPYLSWTNVPSPNFITFADETVKAICVANWDTNGDGELSMAEAATVTDLGQVFKGNEEITSFDELQYFTGLTSIGDHAFNNCHSLQSVIIPENVTSIGQEAFSGSYQLNSVNIPYTVTSIGMWAFNYGAFQQITIPSSVTSIGEYAFDNCNRLTSIIVEWEEPLAVPENIFENINYNNAVLYVPEESKASYKSADVWKEFFFDGDDREEYNAKRLLRELIANMEAIGGYELDEAKATVDNANAPKEDYESTIAQLQQQIKDRCANAGEDGLPVDATGLITNPSFTFETASYWQGGIPQFQTYNNAEFYMTTFNIYQELTGLPNGRYMLKVQGFHRPGYNQDVYSDFQQGTDNASALLYANNESVVLSNHAAFAQDEQIDGWIGVEVNHNGTTQYVPDSMHDAYMWFNNGYYENELPVTVIDGTLRLGIRLDESVDHGWVIFDDFRLEYLGSDSDNNIEYTDLSKYDNVIYVEEQTVATDVQTTTLSVKMNNEMGVRGFQFDLVLPNGMTVAQDEDGFYMVDLSTERTTTRKMNLFDAEMLEDGSLRVLCNSSGGYTFDGNEGEVCTITIYVGEQEGGDYPIIVKNIVFTDVSAIRHPISDDIITKLIVSNFTPGDVNNDTFVDVADLALVCNYILERDMEVFIFKAADMNNDNIVDVSDLAGVCNIILHREMSNSPMAKAPSASSANITIEASSSNVLPGEKIIMPIILNNPSDEVSSLQMDLLIPKGFRVTDISMSNDRRSNQYVEYEAIGDHKVRVLYVSPNNRPLKGFDGAVLMVEMEASRALNEGSYPLAICNTILTSYGNRMTTSETTAMMEVGNATAITECEADGHSNSNIYSLNGSRLNQPQRGVNIMRDNKGNAHKIIKKK